MAQRRGKRNSKKNRSTNSYLVLGGGVLVLGLLAFGAVWGFGSGQPADQAVIEANGVSLETVSLEGGRQSAPGESNHETASEEDTAVVDRETRYLGPASDPAALALAETGELGQPALIWFHADWCHICQQVKPDVVNLGEAYDGQVKIVRLNVDYPENRNALRRYGVRGTPVFVLFDADGQIRGNVPGWPGYQTFTTAFDQLLTEG